MTGKVITFKDLDKRIEDFKDDVPQRTALLILKSGAKPLKNQGIPKATAVRIISAAKTGEDLLVQGFAADDQDELYVHHDDISKALAKVVDLLYTED